MTRSNPCRLRANVLENADPTPRRLAYHDRELDDVRRESQREIRRRLRAEEEEYAYLEQVDEWYFDQKHRAPPVRRRGDADCLDECCFEYCSVTTIMVVFGCVLVGFMAWNFWWPAMWGFWSSTFLFLAVLVFAFTSYNLFKNNALG